MLVGGSGLYFRAAVELQGELDKRFPDPRGGYYFSTEKHDGLILRPKETLDGATPSSNSVAAMNLLRLATFTGERKYREAADGIFSAFSGYLTRAAIALPRLLCALDYRSDAVKEIVLSGEPGREDFERLRAAVFASKRLNRVVAHADSGSSLEDLSPLIAGRAAEDGEARAYVCQNFACRRPTSDPAELLTALEA
jgi:hypothetical protein